MIVSDLCKNCIDSCCISCKNLTEKGCRLDYNNRPESCRIFPYYIRPTVSTSREDTLFICISCPNWKDFIKYEKEIREIVGL